jgi:glucose/arabinose dehydrogenase
LLFRYFGIGDKDEYRKTGDKTLAGNMSRAGSKIHRIHLNGSAVAGNMGLSDPDALDTIFAIGYRNPYRAFWDADKHRLIVADVGAGTESGRYGWEDIHVVTSGSHGGWPHCEGPCSRPASVYGNQYPDCNCSKHDDPVITYPHVRGAFADNDNIMYDGHYSKYNGRPHYLWGDGEQWGYKERAYDTGKIIPRPKQGAAVIGGVIYKGTMFPKKYQGRYIWGDFVRNVVFATTLAEDDNDIIARELPVNYDQDRLTYTPESGSVILQ